MDSLPFINSLYQFFVTKRPFIIQLFKIFYILQCAYILVGAYLLLNRNVMGRWFAKFDIDFGEIGIVLFFLILIPGIARRFGLKHKLLSLLKIYRRYLGICMFLFILMHSTFLFILPFFEGIVTSLPLYEWFGLSAGILLFFLFLTSNDYSVKLLRQNWYLLHRSVYIIMFLILAHVTLQKPFGIWAILTYGIVILEVGGKLYQLKHMPK